MGNTTQNHPVAAAPETLSEEAEEFLALLEECHTTVYAVALARLRDRDAAEDLAQEAFLRAFVQYDRGRGRQSLLPWLICVTRNLATDWIRREQRTSRLNPLVAQADDTIASVVSARIPSPREQVMKRQESEALVAAMSGLTDEQRELVLMHYMEGRSRREISERLGVHPSTVGRQLDTALARLKGALEPVLREQLSTQRPRPVALGRTAGAVVALAGVSATARAQLLASAAWQEGSAAATAALGGSEGSLITAASAGAKGAMVMAKGKTAAGVAAGLIALIGVGVVAVQQAQRSNQAPTANSIGPSPGTPASPLPDLPAGWVFDARPSAAGTQMRSASRPGMMEWRGMNLTNALHAWDTPARVIDPAVEAKTQRFDVTLRAPSAVAREEFSRVQQIEMQRLFGFRAVMEKRTIPCLVLTSPGGTPPAFRPAGGTIGISGGETVWQFKGCDMELFARNVAGNRRMPVFDETGIEGRFDFEMPSHPMNEQDTWSDEAIDRLGLKVKHEEREADVLFVMPAD